MDSGRRIKRALVFLLLLASAPTAEGALTRYHYVQPDPSGTMQPQSSESVGNGGRGARFSTAPGHQPPRATHVLTFRHPYSGASVSVPVALPEGTPRIDYRNTRVTYSYSGYSVGIQFLRDGSVDVIYNSGLRRASDGPPGR